ILQEQLPERRWGGAGVAPAQSPVERPVVAAVVEADARVVLAGHHIAEVPRVDRDRLLGLTPQGAVLVDADVVDAAVPLIVPPAIGLEYVRTALRARARGRPEVIAGGVAPRRDLLSRERVCTARGERVAHRRHH